MKRLASALLIAFGALCLHADDKTTTATTTSTQPPVDSPLVRAAKASQGKLTSKSKKKIVITNETLAKSGGHITTSNAQPALPPVPKVDPNTAEIARQNQLGAQQAAAEKAKKEAEDKKKREDAYRANAVLEGDDSSMGLGDPAMIEGHAEQASPAPPSQPPTVQTKKPPTSFR
jgi:hypothetical protein